MANKINVILYTIPQEACGSQQMSWYDVAEIVNKELDHSFDEKLEFGHVEFMGPDWFNDEQAQSLLEKGEVNFPFVLVNGEVACADKKVNLPKIKKFIQNKIQS